MAKSNGHPDVSAVSVPALTSLSVCGFKSIVERQTLEIRPLTLLAGANSSGKSSMIQPLLLLKQTLEAPYDPGPLLLSGSNVKFTSAKQFLSITGGGEMSKTLSISIEHNRSEVFDVDFEWDFEKQSLEVVRNAYKGPSGVLELSDRIEYSHLAKIIESRLSEHMIERVRRRFESGEPRLNRHAFFLRIALDGIVSVVLDSENAGTALLRMIHVPGLRGNPERIYPINAVGAMFPGTFDHYVASVIDSWSRDTPKLVTDIGEDLRQLGLTWGIAAVRSNDTQVELRVKRTSQPKRTGDADLVNIADVGFGVSQSLPVIVALRAAIAGQLVYIEQPEIHLHPRAQVAMARLLVDAANRGVRVVAETHSSLLLLAVQTLVAEGTIKPGLVGLNWFERDKKTGATRINAAELDDAGRFGEWPEDFDEVTLDAENRYLSAAEERLSRG